MSRPVVDLARFLRAKGEERRRIAKRVDAIFRDTGFLLVEGHGVPASLRSSVVKISKDFFALPSEMKKACAGKVRGWLPEGAETLDYGRKAPPDLCESFVMGPSGNVWPRRPRGFRTVMTRYYREMGKFSNGLLKLFAAALELDEDFFLSQADKPISRLRARHYPAHDARPLKGQLRAGAHTDYGDFTILLPDARVKGLQIKGRGGWRAAPAKDGAFLVNLGDLMARWTNDRWASTRHRVANEALGKARLTIAYFHYPNFDARVSCAPTCRGRRAKYPPVRAGEYLRRKLSVTIR